MTVISHTFDSHATCVTVILHAGAQQCAGVVPMAADQQGTGGQVLVCGS